MKRLLISICGGLSIPLVLFVAAATLLPLLQQLDMEWAARFLFDTFMWPLRIWAPIFPNPCESCGPSDAAIIATIITDFLLYSSLTHLIQVIIARARRRGVESLSESRA